MIIINTRLLHFLMFSRYVYCNFAFFEGFFFLFKNFRGDIPTDFETIEGTIMKLFLMSLGEYKVSSSSVA